MNSAKNLFTRYYSELTLISILFLFFIELIADFVEAVYALCLLTLSLNENVLTVLLLLSPILMTLLKNKAHSRILFLILGELIIISRLLEALFVSSTQIKMIFAGFGVGGFLLFIPLMYYQMSSRRKDQETAKTLGLGLLIALLISIVFRTFGNTIDISTVDFGQVIGWGLGIIASFMLIGYHLKSETNPEDSSLNSTTSPPSTINASPSSLNTVLLTFGVLTIFLLIYFSFSSPTVISRWTGSNYFLIVFLLGIVLAITAIIILVKPEIVNKLNTPLLWGLNIIHLASLVSTLLLNQVVFPSSVTAYPLIPPSTTIIHDILLLILILTIPVLIIDFIFLSKKLIMEKPSMKQLSGSFTIVSFFFLLMIFAHIFTTVYDYIPEIGPIFRDQFWFVHLLVALGIMVPILQLTKKTDIKLEPTSPSQIKSFLIIGVFILLSVSLVTTSPYPPTPEDKSSLKILTYNIRQGYSLSGVKNFDGQLAILKEIDADIIGLQESDAARISGGNCDPVRYFANQLHLYSYYGPKSVTGTFGIALLSKYPIKMARTFFMYSIGEQTACIHAEIEIGAREMNIFVTHLGNGGPIIQQENILEEVSGKNNVILMGDFNFRPFTVQYNITTAVLNDSWTLKWPSWIDDQNYNGSRKIDHIFVSIGTVVVSTEIIESDASDHPAVWAEIEL